MRKLISLLFIAALVACNGPQNKQQDTSKSDATQNKPIEDRVLAPATALSPLFDSLRPATQTFTIKGDKDTLITGHNGTSFSIVKNTFVNEQGQPAATITISLLEANSMDEIVKCNLQTIAGNRVLQSGGMFFLDAKENGKSLAIASGKSIAVEVKAYFYDPKMTIFEGKFDDKGKIDWTYSGSMESNLIALPFDLFNFQRGGLECAITQEQVKAITQPKFANTYLATREFEARAELLNVTSCEQYHGLEQQLLNIYLSNTDKPLYIADSLAADYLLKHNKALIDTTRAFEFNETGWITAVYQQLQTYIQQHFTYVIDFNKPGITEATTAADLVSKGYSQADAEKYIALFKLRKQAIKSKMAEKQTFRMAAYTFSTNKLGWVNVDCLIRTPPSAVSTFDVQTKSKDSLDHVTVCLVIPRFSVSVMAIHSAGSLHSFTKKEDGYRNLPVGEEAQVVAFGYKDNVPWFGQQTIRIPKDGRITVELKPSTIAAISSAISHP